MTRRLAHLMDALSRGASPPGMIDMIHTRHTHLRRRFTMIARYDGRSGRWSATGLALSLLIAGVSFTGAVNGQDAAPAGPAAAQTDTKPQAAAPAAPAAGATPVDAEKLWADKYAARSNQYIAAREDAKLRQLEAEYLAELKSSGVAREEASATPAARPIRAREVKAIAAAARKVWEEKYAPRLVYVDGREVNREAVDKEFIEEVTAVAGSEENGKRVLNEMAAQGVGKVPVSGAAPAPAQPAAARQVSATPAGGPIRPARPRTDAVDAETAQKLWDEKYASRLYYVNGAEVNREAVDREYLAELATLSQAKPTGAAPAKTGDAQPAVRDEDVDAALLAQLDRKLPEANFDGAALSDVVDFLRDVSGANMVVEWGHLANAGVDRNAPVTLRVRDVRFSKALDLVLSSAAPGVPVGYSLDGNIIRVSTREHLDGLTDVRAYDVRDILASEAQMTDLTKLITESVAPDTWRNAGGSIGVILPTRNKLVVTQTPMNHRQIRSVLQMLRDEPRGPARASDAASAAQAPAAGTRN